MKAVLQRVAGARVTVNGETVGAVGRGLAVMLGVTKKDGAAQAALLAGKIAALRIFEDETGKLNRSLLQIGGEALAVSNFTLCADCSEGRRPDFTAAAPYARAETLYDEFVAQLKAAGVSSVQTGLFGADMRVELSADGPVTIILDTDDLE